MLNTFRADKMMVTELSAMPSPMPHSASFALRHDRTVCTGLERDRTYMMFASPLRAKLLRMPPPPARPGLTWRKVI